MEEKKRVEACKQNLAAAAAGDRTRTNSVPVSPYRLVVVAYFAYDNIGSVAAAACGVVPVLNNRNILNG